MLPHLWRGGLLLVLLFGLIQVIPIAFGQRNVRKSSINTAPESPAGACSLAWQTAAIMPTDFFGGAAASDGTYGYVAGGYSFSSGQSLNSLYRYDPAGNVWTTLPPYPGFGFIMGVAVYYPTTNRIYVFGGEDAVSGTNYNNTRIFDIATSTWLVPDGATMFEERSFMAGGYNPGDGMIYILSGYKTGNVTSAQPNTWQYNPVTNVWTNLTGTVAYPHAAGGFGYGVINNHIYTAGGRDSMNIVINLTYDFNPATLTYTLKSPEPGTNNNVPGSGVAQGALWVFGGGNPFSGPGAAPGAEAAFAKQVEKLAPNVKAAFKPQLPETTNSTLIYSPAMDAWNSGPNMTSARSFPGGTNIGTKMLAAGGYDGASTTNTAETLNATCLPTPTPTPCPGDQYTITHGTDPIVPGTTNTGNHCDDCSTTVALPFPFRLYGNIYSSVGVVSNGYLDFVTPNTAYNPSCLPDTGFDYTIYPFWTDLRTDMGLSGCTTWANDCGIFTSVSGTAPNRVFNIEWHAVLYIDNAQAVNFEVRLYEGDPQKKFEIIFGTMNAPDNYVSMVSGVQGDSGSSFFTQDFCLASTDTPPSNSSSTYTSAGCGPTALSAVSRKTHAGGCGTFDIPLPLTGSAGVEDRSTGGNYTVVVTFSGNETVTGASVTCHNPGTGTGTTGAVGGSGTPVITIPLTGVSNAQTLTVHINGTTNADIPMSILIGDTNGNGTVNAADIAQTKGRTGQTVDATNFRSDVNANCAINAGDIGLIKGNSGTSVPGSCP